MPLFHFFFQTIVLCSRASNKEKMASVKTKISAASSSRIEDEDVEMLDASYKSEHEMCPDENEEQTGVGEASEDHDAGDDDGDDDDGVDEGNGDVSMPSSDPPVPGNIDASAALAIFGDYRQFGSYMMSLSSRLKTMLNNIKPTADPTTRLLTLQELSELLSISTEDTLAGSFQVEQFVRELVKVLGGHGVDEDEDEDDNEDHIEQDEDAALAAALAMSNGNTYQGDENLEAQVLACRCLANLMEALPGVAHTVVYHGAIPVLCSKLIEISYIDLAEQTLSVSSVIALLADISRIPHRRWKKFLKSFLVQSCARVDLLLSSTIWTFSLLRCNVQLCKPPPTAVGMLLQSISP